MGDKKIQHQPIRVPQGWTGQEVTLIMQIERLFDEVFRRISMIEDRLKELEEE